MNRLIELFTDPFVVTALVITVSVVTLLIVGQILEKPSARAKRVQPKVRTRKG